MEQSRTQAGVIRSLSLLQMVNKYNKQDRTQENSVLSKTLELEYESSILYSVSDDDGGRRWRGAASADCYGNGDVIRTHD